MGEKEGRSKYITQRFLSLCMCYINSFYHEVLYLRSLASCVKYLETTEQTNKQTNKLQFFFFRASRAFFVVLLAYLPCRTRQSSQLHP